VSVRLGQPDLQLSDWDNPVYGLMEVIISFHMFPLHTPNPHVAQVVSTWDTNVR
jgi:hypothetical protein